MLLEPDVPEQIAAAIVVGVLLQFGLKLGNGFSKTGPAVPAQQCQTEEIMNLGCVRIFSDCFPQFLDCALYETSVAVGAAKVHVDLRGVPQSRDHLTE